MAFNNHNTKSVDRLTRKVLTMHFLENVSQSDISKELSLSPAKVNRIIRSAWDEGLVEISLNIGGADAAESEQRLVTESSLHEAILSPSVSSDPVVNFRLVAETAADYLLDRLRDGDVICVSGGKAISALVEVIKPKRSYNVTVVPATGGVQGKFFTDVNHLAYTLAEKLGGRSMQLHAPLFADSREDRDILLEMRACKEVLELARTADIALVGIGAVAKGSESYFDLRPMSDEERNKVIASDCEGEMLAHLINRRGESSVSSLDDKLVGLTLDELRKIPLRVGIAASKDKILPVRSVLNGGMITTLVSDEATATSVLEILKD